MIDPTSRYAAAPQADLDLPDGGTLRLMVPPILPHPDDHLVARQHRMSDSDRADIVAARDYGQATAWWMIANANTVAHPDQLDTPGAVLAIPLPDGRGGAG